MRVITYGTFDLLHYGHLNLLKRCSLLGDELFVGISTDEFCIQKGKKVCYSYEKRAEMVSDLKYVTSVFPEHNMAQKVEDVKKYNIDIFVLGSDYKEVFPKMPEYELVSQLCKVVFLDRTPDISTTKLKNLL